MENYCRRTYRACIGGAYDDGDGWGIDCPTIDHENCPYKGRKKVEIVENTDGTASFKGELIGMGF